MKKLIAMFLAALTALSLTACAAKSDTQPDASEIPDALTILNTVWASYSEDEKIPCGGRRLFRSQHDRWPARNGRP